MPSICQAPPRLQPLLPSAQIQPPSPAPAPVVNQPGSLSVSDFVTLMAAFRESNVQVAPAAPTPALTPTPDLTPILATLLSGLVNKPTPPAQSPNPSLKEVANVAKELIIAAASSKPRD